MIVSKNCYSTQMPFKIDRKGTIISVTTVVFTGDLEVCLQRFQWISGLSPWRPFRFSAWWFDNSHFNSCSLKCLQNALFVMSFIKVNQNPNIYDFTENGQYICNSYLFWWLQHVNKYIYFQFVCFIHVIAITELATVTTHFVAISVLISMVDFSLDVVA